MKQTVEVKIEAITDCLKAFDKHKLTPAEVLALAIGFQDFVEKHFGIPTDSATGLGKIDETKET